MDRALLFDWGGTLMENMPAYLGPSRGWSYEPPVPGVLEVVSSLHQSWRIALASNASESDEEEVRTALDTIGVGGFMEHIYTYRRVGRPKPWPEFWKYVLRDLSLPPASVVMVGDDYMGDVWGATSVGMYGVWLNRFSNDVKTGAQHRTIHSLAQLPDVLHEFGFV